MSVIIELHILLDLHKDNNMVQLGMVQSRHWPHDSSYVVAHILSRDSIICIHNRSLIVMLWTAIMQFVVQAC